LYGYGVDKNRARGLALGMESMAAGSYFGLFHPSQRLPSTRDEAAALVAAAAAAWPL
jgi:hypothetical protein